MQMAIQMKDICPPVINVMVCPPISVRIWLWSRLKVVQADSFFDYFEVILEVRFFFGQRKAVEYEKNYGNLQHSCEKKLSEQSSREISSKKIKALSNVLCMTRQSSMMTMYIV